MKWILLLSSLIAWLSTVVVNAQVPHEISYQAAARDASGVPLALSLFLKPAAMRCCGRYPIRAIISA